MRVSVVGAGSWGTTLANLLACKGYAARLWVREPELLEEMKQRGENPWFLPSVPLSGNIHPSSDLSEVLASSSFFLFVVPCQFLRRVLRQAKGSLPDSPVIICASKGIELENLKPMSQIVQDELGPLSPRYAILSGPSFAKEVSCGLPTAVSLGCADLELGRELQGLFSTEAFRVYANEDYRGVELGGALKNVMAIATGISDGLEFGLDARAALITRGLAEMSRLGKAIGANPATFMGLSGIGDLVLTCTGDLSRNRQVGLRLGRGEKLQAILADMQMVAEGVKTAEAVYRWSRELGIELPISEQVYSMLYEDKEPAQAVQELMQRELKEE